MKKSLLVLVALMGLAPTVFADGNGIAIETAHKPLGPTLKAVNLALKKNGFKVVKTINIGKKLAMAAHHFHWKNYNENHLKGIATVVFCNAGFANAITNADPDAAAVCPLHMTLVQEGADTKIEYIRPTAVTEGSKAAPVAQKLEAKLDAVAKEAVK